MFLLKMWCVVEMLLKKFFFPICLAKKRLDIDNDMTSSGRYWGLSLQKCLPETAFKGNSFPSEKKREKRTIKYSSLISQKKLQNVFIASWCERKSKRVFRMVGGLPFPQIPKQKPGKRAIWSYLTPTWRMGSQLVSQ